MDLFTRCDVAEAVQFAHRIVYGLRADSFIITMEAIGWLTVVINKWWCWTIMVVDTRPEIRVDVVPIAERILYAMPADRKVVETVHTCQILARSVALSVLQMHA